MINTFTAQLISDSSSHGRMGSLLIGYVIFFARYGEFAMHALPWEPLL